MSTPTPSTPQRPMSPFMLGQYYRFQLTSALSFVHRMTGVGLSIGTLLLAGWLTALAAGPDWYWMYSHHLTAWYGQVLLFAWSWSFLYHLCNGIRHLFWDVGKGFELAAAYRSGYAVLIVSTLLTIAAWALAYLR